MNTVKMPGGTRTRVKVWTGQGNNEAFLDFVMQVGGLIKCLGYWTAIVEADEAFAAAKQALTDAEAALKAARKKESQTRTKASAIDAEKANALEKKTAAAKALDAALKRNVLRPLKSPSSSMGVISLRASNPRGKRSSLN
jgi:hypothetical protein